MQNLVNEKIEPGQRHAHRHAAEVGGAVHPRQSRDHDQRDHRSEQVFHARETVVVKDDQEVGAQQSRDRTGRADRGRVVVVIVMTKIQRKQLSQDH